MSTPPFDPEAPLAGPPDPWTWTSMPSPRDDAPYHMTEMIAAEARLARRILGRHADPGSPAARLAATIRETAAAGRPVVLVGCGTSEHGALGAAEILRESMAELGLPNRPGQGGAPIAVQAFEASLEPTPGGLVIGISHEGSTGATNRALETARAAGARVAILTVTDRSPGAAIADAGLVVTTEELDHSWCHTIGYLSPLLAATAVAGHIRGAAPDAAAAARLLAAGTTDEAGAEAIAAHLADARTLLVVGSGADRPAARELVLKVEEASWLPSAMRDLETFLHGHLPSTDASTGLVLILTDRSARPERVARAREALAAARIIGIRSAAILAEGASADLDPMLTPAGRLVVGEEPGLPAAVAALLGSATPLQLLTERIARARGTNPDPIRRDDPRYRDAAAAAE
ncbi:MAG: hypothetical protein AABZ33_00300 [Chloroflexota bacterium]